MVNPTQTTPGIDAPYEVFFADELALIHAALDGCFAQEPVHPVPGPQRLWEALRYGTLLGGKRIRPLMALATCRVCGGRDDQVLPTACAIELVHAQSLIHDDLPCMDNDDLRRGKPTVHKAFDESTAVLAGDALLSMAFGLIADKTPLGGKVQPQTLLQVIQEFAKVTSVQGLVNGQFVDIYYEGKSFDGDVLDYIHTYKTGALFTFSIRSGALLAGAPEEMIVLFTALGQKLGLAFQIVDDLLDIQSTPEALGKTPGKDQVQQKATYPALYGLEASRQKVDQLTLEANQILETIGRLAIDVNPSMNLDPWRYIIRFLCHRIH